MNRQCKRCGASAEVGERFCHYCGTELPIVGGERAKKENAKKQGVLIAAVVLAALVLCGSAWLGLGGMDKLESGASCAGCAAEHGGANLPPVSSVSSGDSQLPGGDANQAVTTTAEATTTTTATTTTAQTTAKPTTTTTQNAKKAEAERIRKLLTSKKWKTTVEGYNANVEFKEDGSAVITVKIGIGFLSITEKVDAAYRVDDNCHAVIQAKYNNMDLGISGTISSSSSDKVVIDRDGGKGKVTLSAA